jgi:hypothetical protein
MNRPLRELLSIDDPAKLAEALQGRYVNWECPGCRRELSQRREFPVIERSCPDCLNRHAFRPSGSIRRPYDRTEALAEVGVPERFRRAFLSRPWPGAVGVNLSLDMWEGEPWAVGVIGDTDSGKTFLLTELFWRRLPFAKSALWIRADRLVEGLFGQGDKEKAQLAYDADLLLIDDLGWGVLGGAVEKLFAVIAHRHAEIKETIWTSNHSFEALTKTQAGAALTRRLQEGWYAGMKGNWKMAVEPAGGAA